MLEGVEKIGDLRIYGGGDLTVGEAGKEAAELTKQMVKEVAKEFATQAISYAAGMGIGFLLGKGFQLIENAGIRYLRRGTTVYKVVGSGTATRLEKAAADEAAAVAIGKDIEKAVTRFEKQKLGQQVKEYENLLKTYKDHLAKYGQQAGQTTGEVNRIERQLQEYRGILQGRGTQFGPGGEPTQ